MSDEIIPEVVKKHDIPTEIFESFLTDLTNAKVSCEMVARLHKTLLVDQILTENTLKNAILGEETPQ